MPTLQFTFFAFLCSHFVPRTFAGRVYIIRHGEKAWYFGGLNEQGRARATNLVNVFSGQASEHHGDTFDVPKALFANWYNVPINEERCEQMLQPISNELGLDVDRSHGGRQPGIGGGGGNAGAAAAMKQVLRSTGGPVLAVWEHFNIRYLVEALGVDKSRIPAWPSSDFDSVYILEFDNDNEELISFHRSTQNFHTEVPAHETHARSSLSTLDRRSSNRLSADLSRTRVDVAAKQSPSPSHLLQGRQVFRFGLPSTIPRSISQVAFTLSGSSPTGSVRRSLGTGGFPAAAASRTIGARRSRTRRHAFDMGLASASAALLVGIGAGVLALRRSLRRRSRVLRKPEILSDGSLPAHIGFIMDGNRRHAQTHGRQLSDYGPGLDAFLRVMRWCAHEAGVEHATFFVLSTENLKRQEAIEDIIARSADRVIRTARSIGARVRFVSTNPEALSDEARETMARVERETDTQGPISLHVDLLVAYGGCSDIAGACRSIALDVAAGSLIPSAVDESIVASRLATAPAPSPDLVIRTRERRLSNFTLFQSAYAEIAFLDDVLWPDISERHLDRAMEDYSNRTRRFGV